MAPVQGILREISFILDKAGIYSHESENPDRLYVVIDDWAVTLSVTDVDVVA